MGSILLFSPARWVIVFSDIDITWLAAAYTVILNLRGLWPPVP
jgi:hypothetical protein